ncbi:hypothetical protein Hanom_Chr12g01078471 [Helianthus anomalus]
MNPQETISVYLSKQLTCCVGSHWVPFHIKDTRSFQPIGQIGSVEVHVEEDDAASASVCLPFPVCRCHLYDALTFQCSS